MSFCPHGTSFETTMDLNDHSHDYGDNHLIIIIGKAIDVDVR
jgi:hypothetical protein